MKVRRYPLTGTQQQILVEEGHKYLHIENVMDTIWLYVLVDSNQPLKMLTIHMIVDNIVVPEPSIYIGSVRKEGFTRHYFQEVR